MRFYPNRIPHLSLSRWKVLKALQDAPEPLTLVDIAEKLRVTRANIHIHLRRARADGLAENIGGHRGWRLTERGGALLVALKALPE